MVAILPDEADVDDQRRQEILEAYANLTIEQVINGPLPTTQLAEILQKNNIDYLELLPALKNHHQNGGEALYYRFDGHWTPAGHRVVSQAIFDYLINNQANLHNFPDPK